MPILNFNLDRASIVDHTRFIQQHYATRGFIAYMYTRNAIEVGAMVPVHKNSYFRMKRR